MADSEDDFERRNRDKFARERDYGDRNRGRDFGDRGRRDYANGGGMKRMPRRDDELGQVAAPAAKRNRFDSACDSFEPQFIHRTDDGHQSVLLTFRGFLATLDESSIGSEEEAIAKYLDYKLEFEKREFEKFFQTHKEEEWFRHKYHPEDSKIVKAVKSALVKKRLEVFNELVVSNRTAGLSLDFINAADIVRLMNAVVVKLEGGSDDDVDKLNAVDLDDESVAEAEKLKAQLKMNENSTAEAEPAAVTETPPANSNGESAADSTDENGSAPTADDKTSDESTKTKRRHKTCSIHFKNIPIDAKLADVETICKQHPGFLRVALTDPLPDAKLQRQGWVTYRYDVNIKEIFWGLKNAKLNGIDLGAVVNRDFKRRVRAVDGVATHRSVVQNDIRQAAKLIALYDHRAGLFTADANAAAEAKVATKMEVEAEAEEANPAPAVDTPLAPLVDFERAVLESKNPLLYGAVEYLVEEESAEEEAYIGRADSAGGATVAATTVPLELDKSLLAVLDKYILYLRVVHSVDYYSCGDYANEDQMPNRLGLIHVRGQPPAASANGGAVLLEKKTVDDYVKAHNARLAGTLLRVDAPSEEELMKLGKRDAGKVLQEFIDANCVELAKDKWLCPLSGKKFKGPEFIQKHLQSKHSEKLDEVRDNVIFLNNYLLDPQRLRSPDSPKTTAALSHPSPQQLQHLAAQQPVPLASITPALSNFDRPSPSLFGGDTKNGIQGGGGGYRTGWNPRFGGGRGSFSGSGNVRPNRYFDGAGGGDNGVRKDPRPQVAYRDLDAPEEIF